MPGETDIETLKKFVPDADAAKAKQQQEDEQKLSEFAQSIRDRQLEINQQIREEAKFVEIVAKGRSSLTDHDAALEIRANKELRRDLDAQLQKLKLLRASRHRALAITHLEDAIMRLGMDLKRLAEENPAVADPRPYPSSYDPSTARVEPTADGLRL